MAGLGSDHSNSWPVCCPSAVCQSPRFSNYVLDGFFVPPVLRFQSSDFASSDHTICIPNETFCTVDSHSKPNYELVSGIHSRCKEEKNEQRSSLIVIEGVNDPEFTRRADEVRQECWTERTNVKADTRLGQRQIPCHDRSSNAMPLRQSNTDAQEWKVLSLAVDSGAAESVIPHSLINDHPIQETEASQNGFNNLPLGIQLLTSESNAYR